MQNGASIPINQAIELLKETREFLDALEVGASSEELELIRNTVKRMPKVDDNCQAKIYHINATNSEDQQVAS